jgi:hypothetical protein
MLSRSLLKVFCPFLFALILTLSVSSMSAGQTPAYASTEAIISPPVHPDTPVKTGEYQEDFSTITLQGSEFYPLKPVIGQADDDPKQSFKRERWQLMWRPADPLDLYICKPRGVTKPPVIIYLYGYPTDTDRYKDDGWCSTTTANGFAAVGFLSANTGARLEMQAAGTTFFSDLQNSLGASVHDVQMILDYLATRGDLDMNHIGMFGQGTGASIAILASAADSRIKALDLLTPWGNWPEFFATSPSVSKEKKAKFTSPEYLAKVANLDPVKWLPQIQATSLRMQDVRASGPMTAALLDSLEAAAPQMALINEYGDPAAFASHFAPGNLPLWLQDRLKPDAKPLPTEKAERIHVYAAEAPTNPLPRVDLPKN